MKIGITLANLTKTDKQKLTALAAKDGMTAKTWLTKRTMQIIENFLGRNDELSPKEIAGEEQCSVKTILRRIGAGAYPNARFPSARVIRIPRSDIVAHRSNTRLAAA